MKLGYKILALVVFFCVCIGITQAEAGSTSNYLIKVLRIRTSAQSYTDASVGEATGDTRGSAHVAGFGSAGTADPGVVTVQGIAGATPILHQSQAIATGGAVPFFNDAVTTAVQIKATQGQLYSLSLANAAAATTYLQVFCKPTASVTLGTTVADFVIRLKTNAGAGDERDIVFPVGVCSLLADGATAGTGITVAGTTSATNNTTAAVSVAATFK